MTLRIRELVIHAEIGRDSDPDSVRKEKRPQPESPSVSKPASMTRRFYDDDFSQDNER